MFSKVNVTDADFGMNGEVSLVCDSDKVSWGQMGVSAPQAQTDATIGFQIILIVLSENPIGCRDGCREVSEVKYGLIRPDVRL